MNNFARYQYVLTPEEGVSILQKFPEYGDLLDKFWNYYLRVLQETGRSKSTVANTHNALRFFMMHSDLVSLSSWQDGKVVQETFLRLKKERDWSESTYNTYRKGLSSYFQVLSDADLIPNNPMKRVKKCPDIPRDQPKFEWEQLTILIEILHTYKTWSSYLMFARNKLFFLLAWYTGARPIELLNISLDSFSSGRKVLSIVWAKGNGKTRMYTLPNEVQEAIRLYILECVKAGREKELQRKFFIGDSTGNEWTYSGVRQVCKRISKRVGFKFTTYMFRRFVKVRFFRPSDSLLFSSVRY